MSIRKKFESNDVASLPVNDFPEPGSEGFSENITKLLDNYDIEVLNDHLDKAMKKNMKLKKKIRKLSDDLELMSKCFFEMLEKNDWLESELKKFKKEHLPPAAK